MKTDFAEPTPIGTVSEGYVDVAGEHLAYREVDWPPQKEKLANIAANKHGGEWDNELLADLLRSLSVDDEIDLSLTGMNDTELEKLLSSIDLGAIDAPGATAAPQANKTLVRCPKCAFEFGI